jgi:hypothetical protein
MIILIIACTVAILLAILSGCLEILYRIQEAHIELKNIRKEFKSSDLSKDLCKRCPHSNQCKESERPGSGHCFAVLQHLDPLKVGNLI